MITRPTHLLLAAAIATLPYATLPCAASLAADEKPAQPNIILILADDK